MSTKDADADRLPSSPDGLPVFERRSAPWPTSWAPSPRPPHPSRPDRSRRACWPSVRPPRRCRSAAPRSTNWCAPAISARSRSASGDGYERGARPHRRAVRTAGGGFAWSRQRPRSRSVARPHRDWGGFVGLGALLANPVRRCRDRGPPPN